MIDETNPWKQEAEPVLREKAGGMKLDEARDLFWRLCGGTSVRSRRMQIAWWAFLCGIQIARKGIIARHHVLAFRVHLKPKKS